MKKALADKITLRHGAVLNGRIVQPPMLTNSGVNDGYVTQDTIDYYAARAQSAGLIIVEYCYVSFSGGPSRSWANNRQQLGIYSDTHVEGLKKIASTLKKGGNKALVQLAHAGREANFRAKQGYNVYAPSAFDFGFLDYEVVELTDKEIECVIEDFGKATKRAIDCGFDGIEIHGANHYLLQQFFSCWSNRRDDEWGGSIENRMKFITEVVKKVFEVVNKYAPKGFIIGYRISPEEIHENNIGYSYEDAIALVKNLTSAYEFDYIHLSMLEYDDKPSGSDKTFGELFRNELPENIRLIIAGGVTSEDLAEDALNYTDLVSIGRGIIIDPEFGKKILEGNGRSIINKITPELIKKTKVTPGMVQVFSDENMPLSLSGRESIYYLHEGGALDKSVIKKGG